MTSPRPMSTGSITDRVAWRLYLVDAEYGSLGYGDFDRWPILEGRYALAVLFEYAATLGLIDVRHTAPEDGRGDLYHLWAGSYLTHVSRYDGLLALRLTSLGAYSAGL